ncbi:hypothetical protein MMM2322_02868 [Microbacterium sp. MM2322]
MTERAVRGPHARLAWVLWAVLLVVAVVSSFLVWFRVISIPRCSQSCDFEMLQMASMLCALVGFGAVAIATILLFVLRSHRLSWVVPVVGIAVVLVVAFVTNHLSDIALGIAEGSPRRS